MGTSMKSSIFAGAVALGLFAVTAANAGTTIIDMGDITDPIEGSGFTAPLVISTLGSFDYIYKFNVTGPYPTFYMSVSETDTTPHGKLGINGDLGLYSGLPTAGTKLDSTPISPFPSPGSQSASINYPTLLNVGSYYVELTGVEAGASHYNIQIGTTISTAAVPEPSTWAMLGLGFAGLGLLGVNKGRKALRSAI